MNQKTYPIKDILHEVNVFSIKLLRHRHLFSTGTS
jgi:hypothetical protein